MKIPFLLLTLTLLTLALPQGEQINHVIFINDKIFYTSHTDQHFGFIDRPNGQYLTTENIPSSQAILRVDSQHHKMVLRKDRNQALIFRLNALNIHPLNLNLQFSHQKIVDVVETSERTYVLTNTDLRLYSQGEMPSLKDVIINSVKKNEWFLKINLLQDQGVLILFLRSQDMCLRILKKDSKPEEKCLFRPQFQIRKIHCIRDGFLVQSKDINYIIKSDFDFYTLKGELNQVTHDFTTFKHSLQTFEFASTHVIDGLKVQGSSDSYSFLIKRVDGVWELWLNNELIGDIACSGEIRRSWVSVSSSSIWDLLVQQNQNKLILFKIDGSSIETIWPVENDQNQQL